MKACRIYHFGPPEVIQYEEIERPFPAQGEVLIRVGAAGVGPWDAWIRAGKSAVPQPLPLTLGSDLSGWVEQVGPGVKDVKVGSEVFGVTNPRFVGAYAEYAVASAEMLAPKPRNLDHVEAASVPVIAVTAWQMLFDHAGLKANQKVLILGAAGNVGAFAVQLAKLSGAHVIAMDRANATEVVRSLGAERVDVAIDLIGPEGQTIAYEALKPGGILVSSVSHPDGRRAEQKGVAADFILVDVKTEQLANIGKLLETGELKPHVGTTLKLEQAREAHQMLDGKLKKRVGKIVLKVT